jgi:hypothetical protein
MDYVIKQPSPAAQPHDWINDPFYKSKLVLGIDIGMRGSAFGCGKGQNRFSFARSK